MTSNRMTAWVLWAALAAAPVLTAQQPQSPPPPGRGGQPITAAPTGPQLLHPMFQDHGVLQRDRPIAVYGDTAPGTPVTVTLDGVSVRAAAGSDGHWSATLPAMAAGGPYALTAMANGETRTASDVLVGDVFFCSGQSNMAFMQRQAAGAAEDARAATDDQIRQFTVPTNASLTPRQTFATTGRWVIGSPQSVGSFSAACYYFARELKTSVHVPIGIVAASYGGARLRTFMSEAALRTIGRENDDLDILRLYRSDPAAGVRRWGAKWESWWTAARAQDGRPWVPEYDTASWKTAPPALGAWALWDGTDPDGFIGQMWMRTSVILTADQASQSGAILDLGSVNQEDETWINGTYLGASSFASRTQYPIPPGVLKAGVNIVTTNIYCGWRDCGMRGPAGNRAIRFGDNPAAPLSGPWKYQEVADGLIGPQLPWGSVHGITLDYNGMVLPVGPYTFRAAVWYQGESDVHFGTEYYTAMLPGLMAEWRRQFGDPNLPFLIVQLPGYGPMPSQPTANTWADLREAQRQAAFADRHAAMAITIDIGDPTDLHPTNKAEVGRRLAIAARHLVYGEPNPAAGPTIDRATRRGGRVVVSFRDVTGALTLRATGPGGFELCGETQSSCRWAEARIEGSTVVLSNADDATRVRYAWGGSPVCPLSDGSGLPAGPFEMPIR